MMIEPPRPCSIMMGATALRVLNVPVRVTSIMFCQTEAGISQNRCQLT